MSKKHYVVWKGVSPGIFASWPEAKAQIDGRKDAQYMGFPSKEEAEAAYQQPYGDALKKRNQEKNGGSGAAKSWSDKPKSKAKPNSKSSSNSAGPPKVSDINIYCDGACSPNPGKSGTGVAIYQQKTISALWYGLHQANGTNNTAELNGLLKSFEIAEHYIKQDLSVQILSDSKYSIDCITKWAKGWKSKGWTRGKGEEIKNLAIIQQSYELYERLKSGMTINHVKGHANIEGNELADRMAVLARRSKEVDFVRYDEEIDIPKILAMEGG
ncbi:MAG: ribonuclease HI [Phenylobacterium sp.]|jgi:ribonuclease HI